MHLLSNDFNGKFSSSPITFIIFYRYSPKKFLNALTSLPTFRTLGNRILVLFLTWFFKFIFLMSNSFLKLLNISLSAHHQWRMSKCNILRVLSLFISTKTLCLIIFIKDNDSNDDDYCYVNGNFHFQPGGLICCYKEYKNTRICIGFCGIHLQKNSFLKCIKNNFKNS